MLWRPVHKTTITLFLLVLVIICLLVIFLHQEAFSIQHWKRVDINQTHFPAHPPHAQHYTLAVMVLSTYGNNKQRQAIRDSWGKGEADHILKFVIGALQLSEAEHGNLQAEHAVYNDLLLLTDLYDDFRNLTRKVLNTFTWADKNLNYSYLLKSDDDSYVRLDRIKFGLKRRTSQNKGFYWGSFNPANKVLKTGRWNEDRWFLCDRYLPYASGAGYVLSADLIRKFVVNSESLVLYKNEDVSVGVWTSAFDIERKHDSRFFSFLKVSNCDALNQVVLNPVTPMGMKLFHLKVRRFAGKTKIKCRKAHLHVCYKYDWGTLPSDCCSESTYC